MRPILKSELIKTLNQQLPNLSKEDVTKSIHLILKLLSRILLQKDRIEIRGFGSFCLRYHKPREARNPKTGEKVNINGKYRIHFKPGKEMRERVNKLP